jgi:hypothetical protein
VILVEEAEALLSGSKAQEERVAEEPELKSDLMHRVAIAAASAPFRRTSSAPRTRTTAVLFFSHCRSLSASPPLFLDEIERDMEKER